MDPDVQSRHSDLPARSLRLTLSYSGTEVKLVRIERIGMLSLPDEPVRAGEGQAGSWVELRDADQRVLYQQLLHNPLRSYVEVPEDPVSGRMRWLATDRPEGVFEVTIPDIPEAETVRLHASPPRAFSEPAAEMLRLNLNDSEFDREAET